MKKYIVTRTATIFNTVEAETPEEAIQIACEDSEELWDIDGTDDDVKAEECGY